MIKFKYPLAQVASAAFFFAAMPAFAQWQVPENVVPIGRGGSTQGFKAVPLPSGSLLIGQSGVPLAIIPTGDVTINATGVTAIGANKVTNSMLAGNIAASKLIGTDISLLGTITSGVWNGTDIAVADGGTGASNAAGARTNLGLAIGTNVQAWDADLDCLAALSGTGIVRRTGAGTCSNGTIVAASEGGLGVSSLTSLPHKTTPTTSDVILIGDQAASGAYKYATLAEAIAAVSSGVTSIGGATGAIALGSGLQVSGNVLSVTRPAGWLDTGVGGVPGTGGTKSSQGINNNSLALYNVANTHNANGTLSAFTDFTNITNPASCCFASSGVMFGSRTGTGFPNAFVHTLTTNIEDYAADDALAISMGVNAHKYVNGGNGTMFGIGIQMFDETTGASSRGVMGMELDVFGQGSRPNTNGLSIFSLNRGTPHQANQAIIVTSDGVSSFNYAAVVKGNIQTAGFDTSAANIVSASAYRMAANQTFDWNAAATARSYWDNSAFQFNVSGTNIFSIGTGATSGTGVNINGRSLTTNGKIFYTGGAVGSAGYTACITAGTGEIVVASSTCTIPSDARLKDVSGSLEPVLAKVMQLNPVRYDMKPEYAKYQPGHQIGFIAQEVEKVFPEFVSRNEDGSMGVKYEMMTSIAIRSIQELEARVVALEAKSSTKH